jgi:hypothetical protein
VVSVQADLQAKAAMQDECPTLRQQTCMFFEVNDLADIEVRLQVEKLLMLRCTTFYEMAETGYLERCDNIAVLAQHLAQPGP